MSNKLLEEAIIYKNTVNTIGGVIILTIVFGALNTKNPQMTALLMLPLVGNVFIFTINYYPKTINSIEKAKKEEIKLLRKN